MTKLNLKAYSAKETINKRSVNGMKENIFKQCDWQGINLQNI